MQKMIGYMRKAIQEFGMLQDGDCVAVGVSGGKDSVALLKGLVLLRRFLGVDFTVKALTLDPGFGGKEGDYSAVQALCDEMEVEYILKRTQIGEIVFDVLKEENPCSLCARMRRGALHDAAKEHGCNKVALGHHYDDAVETFLMNLFQQGRIGCFAPVSYLSRKDITIIRPLVFAPEKEIASAVARNHLPVVKSVCPADGVTERQRMKEYLRSFEKESPGITYRLFGAMRRAGIDGWGYTGKGSHRLNPPPQPGTEKE